VRFDHVASTILERDDSMMGMAAMLGVAIALLTALDPAYFKERRVCV
jgi:hypothetical protein